MSQKKFSDLEELKIVEMYLSGLSTPTIGKEFDTSTKNICSLLKRRGVQIRERKKVREQSEVIIELYNQGLTAPEIRIKTNIGLTSIYRILHKAGIEPMNLCRKGEKKGNKKFQPGIEQEIIEKYLEKISMSALAKEYGVNQVTIRNILKRNDVKRRSRGGVFRELTEHELEELRQKWRNNDLILDILDYYQVSHPTLCRWLRQIGEQPRRGVPSGSDHVSWKGGIVQSGDYLAQWADRDDPFYCMANSQGYVPQHRYVMAKSLNRPLLDSETVHHIDGNRQNNNLDNLQLRVGQHGSGQVYCCGKCGSRDIVPVELD